MSLHRDPSLPLPAPPRTPPPALDHPDPGLALAGRAGDGRVAVEGERARARIRERGGVEAVLLDGVPAASALEVAAGVSVNVVASPGLLRRERVAGGASWAETVLVPPRLPLVAVQLRPGSGPAVRVAGSVVLLPGATALRWNAGEGMVAVSDDRHPDRSVVLWAGPGGSVEVADAPADGGGLAVSFSLEAGPDAPATVAVGLQGGGADDPLRALPHLTGHLRGASSGPADGVRLDTGVPELDDGLSWARTRTATAARRAREGTPAWALFWTGLGALAGGDADAAERLTDLLLAAGSDDGPGEPRGHEEALHLPSGPLGLLLAARLALATGNAGHALRALERRGDAGPGAFTASGASLGALALRALADGLRWSVGEDRTDALRREADAVEARRSGGRAPGGGMRLPVVGGGGGAPDPGAVARALLAHEEGVPEAPPGSPLGAWAHLRGGAGAEGYAAWRSVLAAGLGDGDAGRGAWDDASAGAAPGAGVVVATLVHGLLGWAPDAPVGRARLAPTLPGHLTRFRVSGLGVGEAEAEMAFHREGPAHCFRLEPTAGRAPPSLVFEPTVAARGVDAVQVDGRAVELDLREGPGGVVVPVQLPLDGPRTVRITARE